MKKIIIFPFNGNGIEAVDCLGTEYELIGFADDNRDKQGETYMGYEVFDRSVINKYPDAFVLAVPGSPASYALRMEIIEQLGIEEKRFATVIHPSASVSKNVKLGINTLIMAGVVLTSNSIVGNHVCILPNSVIHHDSSVGNYSIIGSNVSVAGGTILGENCYIGSGSCIINGINIGDGVLVGISSNVIRSIEKWQKVAGNPAKILI